MTRPTPSLSVNVDVTNPGQFFACCGLLELAHRLWPGAEGWFGFDAEVFNVWAPGQTGDPLNALAEQLRNAQVQASAHPSTEQAVRPLTLSPFGITLDWWVDHTGKNTSFKLWAGQQTSFGIFETLRLAVSRLANQPNLILNTPRPLTGRFGLDPRSAWNALGAGFSPNEQAMKVVTFPAVELLGAVGLQRFRPNKHAGDTFAYAAWTLPLPPSVACAAAAGTIPAGKSRQYRFRIAVRGSYKGFDFATPIQEQGR